MRQSAFDEASNPDPFGFSGRRLRADRTLGSPLSAMGPYDRNGISIAQGDLECDEEAEDSTTNIGGFADRVLSFDQIKAKCLRLRGY
jgi:hypothetical protein